MTEETTELLERHFETAFDAPDGIQKLRELILTLAMQGKLVEQDPNDLPASKLLDEIKIEKCKQLRNEKSKNKKSIETQFQREIPYGLASSWVWTTLDELAKKIGSGSTPRGGKSAYLPEGIAFLRSQNVWNDGLRIGDVAFISEDIHNKMAATKVMPMDILLNITGASLGRCALVPETFEEANVSQHVTIIRCVNPKIRRFLHYLLLSPYGQSLIWTKQVGMSREGLSKKVLEQFQIPLPPLLEQRRIVAKIDQLMARCDKLEKLRTERGKKRITVHTAALNRLFTAQSSDSFTDAWRFIAQHFGELYSVKENVAELRKAILQIAVMGKLVEQDPSDEPASELLKKIEVEKQQLIQEGKLKESKPLLEISPEERPYLLPKSWEWTRLGDVSLASDAGRSPQCLRRRRIENEWGVLKVSAVSWGEFNPNENKALPPEKKFRPEDEVKAGDFLISRANTEELVARSVVVKTTPPNLLISDKVIRFTLSENVSRQFINIANLSEKSREYYATNASGTSSSMKNVTRYVMCKLPIPLPPLPEQHRIVAKVDQLMTLCDTLEQQIDKATQKQTALLDAVMAQV